MIGMIEQGEFEVFESEEGTCLCSGEEAALRGTRSSVSGEKALSLE
jgi:hypothetical protein